LATIGVLSLQGDFAKHEYVLKHLGVRVVKVRSKGDLEEVNGLVIPGGESTTIGKLLKRFDILEDLKERIEKGMPVFGTCAGMIILAKEIEGDNQPKLGILDITVARNAYGRQIESFEADIFSPFLGTKPIRAVFIRAPQVVRIGKDVEILASFEEKPVLIQQKNILSASFHPELTEDRRIHKYFLSLVGK